MKHLQIDAAADDERGATTETKLRVNQHAFFRIYLRHCREATVIKIAMGLSRGTKQKLEIVLDVTKTVFHWGFLPTVLYLGFRKGAEPGMPPLAFMNLLWA